MLLWRNIKNNPLIISVTPSYLKHCFVRPPYCVGTDFLCVFSEIYVDAQCSDSHSSVYFRPVIGTVETTFQYRT